jgi:NAD(P)-dependent dehydrogenase (short-subunit alcohol dehydrogenase family)
MDLNGKVVVITGAASGIGAALAQSFSSAGALGLILGDLNLEGLEAVAKGVGGVAVRTDVTREAEVKALVETAERDFGRCDLVCSNAGVAIQDADLDNAASASDAAWTLSWSVNVMAHVYAARAALPGMIRRRSGYFLHTVSAAGLLSQIGSAAYSTTKHAAVGFAESLAITHKPDGIGVSILCPQAVDTPMLGGARGSQSVDGVLSPEEVAQAALQGLARETFLILPHPQVLTYMRRKTDDYDRWVKGMARLRASVRTGARG